ncbi:MAG: hypothetical protein J5615_01595 [Fibrobacter sp.]|nr:hypothetical protein [Fibrobacter sp.]
MAGINDLIDEYLGVAMTPGELRDLAMLQVKDASVQDDAVARAVANAQGVEQRNRSALEEYLIAAEQQAAAESQKALEMAQQRLNALDQNAALLASTVGIGKEGRQKLASIEAERQAILQAFPQLGGGNGAGAAVETPEAFDVKKMLADKDYSPESVAKLFDANDWDVWDEALRTGDLDLYQAMLDGKLGDLPEGMADKMKFVIGGKPETSKALKLDDKYARLRGLIGETQGDVKKKDRDEKAAAAKAKKEEEENELLKQYEDVMNLFLEKKDRPSRRSFVDEHPGFYEQMDALKKAHKLPADVEEKVNQTKKKKV